MFNATSFCYDGIDLQKRYDMIIADFNSENVTETEAVSPTLSLSKAPCSLKFMHEGIDYDSAPTYEISVLGTTEINKYQRRQMLSWLIGRNEFKPLTFSGGDNENLTYYCVFTSAKTIYVNGKCYGFKLTCQFDSPYVRGQREEVVIPAGDGTKIIDVDTDIIDAYIYPQVCLPQASILANVTLINLTDEGLQNNDDIDFIPARHPFKLNASGCDAGDVIIDGESAVLASSVAQSLGDRFNGNWLRLRNGENIIRYNSATNVVISWQPYYLIGF